MTLPPLQKIMIIEDDPDIQTVARMALEAIGGFTVEACSSGREALDKVAGFAPDLFLLDVMMPEMDGPTTLKGLRAQEGFETTPVIFCTAKAMPSELEQYREMGAAGIVAKPFDPMTLAEQVREVWKAYHD
jgi:CheY-like chemotaxis protein